jgi:hypothetical protein
LLIKSNDNEQQITVTSYKIKDVCSFLLLTHSKSQQEAAISREVAVLYTDKKENLIFLIYEEIQNGAVAKSYKTNDLHIYGEIFAHFLIYVLGNPSSYMTLQLLHSEFPYI